MTMTIYDYFNALTNIGLGEEHTEEFEDAINDTLTMIQQGLPDDTEMLGITLGEFKKLAQITDNEIKILKGGLNNGN